MNCRKFSLQSVPFQHWWSLNVWCGIIRDFVIDPYFLEETVTSNSYCNLLQNHLPVLLKNVPLNIRRETWFQQDGALLHFFANIIKQLLKNLETSGWIVVNLFMAPSISGSTLNFFLWGYVKKKVMFEPPMTKENVKQRIRDACASRLPKYQTLEIICYFE